MKKHVESIERAFLLRGTVFEIIVFESVRGGARPPRIRDPILSKPVTGREKISFRVTGLLSRAQSSARFLLLSIESHSVRRGRR